MKDPDLFAVGAKFHRPCRMKFTTYYHNHVRAIQREQSHEDTDQSRKTAAHNQAFKSVLDFVQEHIKAGRGYETVIIATDIYQCTG